MIDVIGETRYTPTATERLALKIKPDMLKVSGDKVFASLQGEGVTAGSPSVFLRLHFCNLGCGRKKGWQCDTPYTWDTRRPEFWQEPEDWSYEKAKMEIETAWKDKFGTEIPSDQKRVVVTGGEPMLQQDKIIELKNIMPEWKFEIETNGTIIPSDKLSDCQFNCSPKLANSGNELSRRLKVAALAKINSFKNSWFKFVVGKLSDIDEIAEFVRNIGLEDEKVLIMPEGITQEATEAHLRVVESEVLKRGWKVTKRNQLVWFGNKRRT